MFRVKKGYSGKVSTRGYLGLIKEASQEVLEHLFHIGHKGVEEVPKPKKKAKKKVDKVIDNKEGEDLPKIEE